MPHIAKLFTNGRSQAVRLPAAFRFDANEVFIRRDPVTGDVVLSRKPTDWNSFFEALQTSKVPSTYLGKGDRKQGKHVRDPFEDWQE
ncbi:MAG: AbrB/MazE/SpoVT family DNA-binding domain-containing protein [Steroidobacter sp.]